MGRTIVTERDIEEKAATSPNVVLAAIDPDKLRDVRPGRFVSSEELELRQLIEGAESEGDAEKAEAYRKQLRAKEEQAEGQPEPEEPYEHNEGEVTGVRPARVRPARLKARDVKKTSAVIGTPSTLASSTSSGVDGYVDKLLKYIPAESVVLYLTLQGIILSGAEGGSLALWLWVIFSIGVVGTPLYLWRIQKVSKMVQLAVSTAAFAIWVFALGGAFESLAWYEPFIGSVMLVVFTFCVPLINPDLFSTNEE